jgi:DUF4097 and DUF4098 domain-containing protein YvlB
LLLISALMALLLSAAPAQADFRLERRLTLAPGGMFTLEAEQGSVSLVGDSPSGVLVTITSTRDDVDRQIDFQFQEQPGIARVTATRKKPLAGWLDYWKSSGNLRFVVHVPRATKVGIDSAGGAIQVSTLDGSARLRTSGGALTIEDVAGDVAGKTSGGAIRVARVTGNVDVNTSGGSVEIERVDGRAHAESSGGPISVRASRGDVLVRTSGGRIQVQDAGGRVEAETSGGPISVAFAPGNSRGGVLSTSGGGVNAVVDANAALSIDAATSGGRVSSDLTLTTHGSAGRNALRGELNGGGAELRLRTSGGPIQISANAAR